MNKSHDLAWMHRFRAILLAALCIPAVLLSGSDAGAIGTLIFVPGLLGWSVFQLFPERSIGMRSWLLAGVVAGFSMAQLCWEAVVRNGWDFSFDGEWGLVAVGVGLQFVFAAFGFAAAGLHRRPHEAA